MTTVNFSWSTRREGNIGYVLETRPNGDTQTFAMPSHLVPLWLTARRKLIATAMLDLGATPADAPLEDYSYLRSQTTE